MKSKSRKKRKRNRRPSTKFARQNRRQPSKEETSPKTSKFDECRRQRTATRFWTARGTAPRRRRRARPLSTWSRTSFPACRSLTASSQNRKSRRSDNTKVRNLQPGLSSLRGRCNTAKLWGQTSILLPAQCQLFSTGTDLRTWPFSVRLCRPERWWHRVTECYTSPNHPRHKWCSWSTRSTGRCSFPKANTFNSSSLRTSVTKNLRNWWFRRCKAHSNILIQSWCRRVISW